MKYKCPKCNGDGIAHYSYPSKKSMVYEKVRVRCHNCGYSSREHGSLTDAVREFERA